MWKKKSRDFIGMDRRGPEDDEDGVTPGRECLKTKYNRQRLLFCTLCAVGVSVQ